MSIKERRFTNRRFIRSAIENRRSLRRRSRLDRGLLLARATATERVIVTFDARKTHAPDLHDAILKSGYKPAPVAD